MPVNRESVDLSAGVWTDLYAATGIDLGRKIAVQNVGSADIRIISALSQPPNDANTYQIIPPRSFPYVNDSDEPGAWAFAVNQGGKLNIWEIT